MFRQRRRKNGSESVTPEARLWWLLYGKLRLPIIRTIGLLCAKQCIYDDHSYTLLANWSFWFCMDNSGSTKCSLDRTYDLYGGNRNC